MSTDQRRKEPLPVGKGLWKGPSAQGWRDLGIFYTDFSNISDHLHVILNKKKSICLVRQNLYVVL